MFFKLLISKIPKWTHTRHIHCWISILYFFTINNKTSKFFTGMKLSESFHLKATSSRETVLCRGFKFCVVTFIWESYELFQLFFKADERYKNKHGTKWWKRLSLGPCGARSPGRVYAQRQTGVFVCARVCLRGGPRKLQTISLPPSPPFTIMSHSGSLGLIAHFPAGAF